MKIYKYVLLIADEQTIEIPLGSKILCVQNQKEDLCIWAEVNPKNNLVKRTFLVIGTGHNTPNSRDNYIGTVQTLNGNLVWHVYEKL